MELWIRSQSKLGLYKVDEIYIDKRDFGNNDIQHYIMTNGVNLGIYKSKERALEVLDEIQKLLKPQIVLTKLGEIVGETCDGVFYNKPNEYDIKELPTSYVYEMPNE